MKPVLLYLPAAVTRPLFWVIEHKAAFITTHVIIGLLLLMEAWKFVKLAGAADTLHRASAYWGYIAVATIALGAMFICIHRIRQRIKQRSHR